MLNIRSKQEIAQAMEENLNRLIVIKEKITEKNLQRDAEMIHSEVIPQLKNTIALSYYFKDMEFFHFMLPLMNVEGYELSEEDESLVLSSYYLREETMSLYGGRKLEVCKASVVGKVFEEVFGTEFLFKKCELNKETNTAHFTLRLIDSIKNINVEEESAMIVQKIDKYVGMHFTIEKIAEEIEQYYQMLQEKNKVALYKRDLERLHLFTLHVEDILEKSDFYSEIELPNEELKIDIYHYLKHSKLMKSLERKLRNYGYRLGVEAKDAEHDTFRSNQIDVSIDAYLSSKEVKKPQLMKSEVLREAFEKKKKEYDTTVANRIKKENEALVSLVESGNFDDYVATTWMKATIMSEEEISGFRFKGVHSSQYIKLEFNVPFNRTIRGLKELERKYYVNDGIGTRYLEMENNIVSAFRKRYPFLEKTKLFGDYSYDYQCREGLHNTESFRIEKNTLEFGFGANESEYASSKREFLKWISSFYGTLDISSILENMAFHGEGVSKKIESYMNEQSSGKTGINQRCNIVLGKVTAEELFKLYQENPMYEKTKDMFEEEFAKIDPDSYSYRDSYTKEFRDAKTKELQSIRLGNLFAYALLLEPMFQEIRSELYQHDYDLKIEYVREKGKEMKTGQPSLYGTGITNEVYEYAVQLVIE